MGTRQNLHLLLLDISTNVYFQPPSTQSMVYPCIVYARSSGKTKFANNVPYNHHKGYTVTVIAKSPDSDIPDKVAALPMAVFSRFFVASNLNHWAYTLYY
jgi:hypothetical protein